jgi:hypothetical protein
MHEVRERYTRRNTGKKLNKVTDTATLQVVCDCVCVLGGWVGVGWDG